MPDKRDPRKDPRVGDVVFYRDKPARKVVKRFTDACGNEWIDYTITKQEPLSKWKRGMRGAAIYHVAD